MKRQHLVASNVLKKAGKEYALVFNNWNYYGMVSW